LRDANGRIRFQPIITFVDRAAKDRFSDAILRVIRDQHGEL
jgi:hypothetical protein